MNTTDIDMLEMVTDRLFAILAAIREADRGDSRPDRRKQTAALTAAATFAACGVMEAAGLSDEGGELALHVGRAGLRAMAEEARSLASFQN